MKNEKMGVKQLLEYAFQSYQLGDIEELTPEEKATYERQIRRTMKEHHLYIQNDENKKNVEYKVTKEQAKYLITVLLHSYFTRVEESNEKALKQKFLEEDERLNEEMAEQMALYYSEEAQNEPLYYSEMKEELNFIMLHAVFNIFYDFDFEAYRKDYKQRKSLVDENGFPLQGYSELNHKLQNPLKYYGRKKR